MQWEQNKVMIIITCITLSWKMESHIAVYDVYNVCLMQS